MNVFKLHVFIVLLYIIFKFQALYRTWVIISSSFLQNEYCVQY